MPEVSIIIPVYNTGKYIAKAVESVLNQTFKDLELIIVDDASTDATYSICEEYAKNDSRVRLFKNEQNLGMMPNWNHALQYITGKFWAKLDSDDWWQENFIEDCYNIISKDETIGMVCGRYIYVDEHDAIIPNSEYHLPDEFKNTATDFIWRVKKGNDLFVPALAQQGNGLIRTDILKRLGKYLYMQPADTEFYFRIGAYYKIHFIDNLYHYHRIWLGSDTRRTIMNQIGKSEKNLFDVRQAIFDYYVKVSKISNEEYLLFSRQNQYEYNKFLIVKYRKENNYVAFFLKLSENFLLFPISTLKFYFSRIFKR